MAESAGQDALEYCPGYVDEHGQWNNGFTCPKWSTSPTQRYCCGTQYRRYCCTAGDETTTGSTTTSTPSITTLSVATPALQNIPLVAGVTIGGVILFVVFTLLCCCLCPCCLMNRRGRGRKRPPPSDEDGSIDSRDLRRRSDISSHTLRTSVNTQFTSTPTRTDSPSPPGVTQLPLVIDRHGLGNGPTRTHSCQNNYRGLVIGTVPPYMREEPPPYLEEMMEGLKPLQCGQLTPEVCPHEEVDPLPHHLANTHLTSPVTNIHGQNFPQVHGQGCYGRPRSPRSVSPGPQTPNACRHMQIHNRWAM